MAYSVLFTLLPNGFTNDGRARLSLVASPRPTAGTLGASEVMRWPEIVASWGSSFQVQTSGGGPPVQATVLSPPPNQALWPALFTPDTPVKKTVDPLSGALATTTESLSFTEEVTFLKELYRQAQAVTEMGPEHPVMQKVAALNAWRPGATGSAAAEVNAAEIQDLLNPKLLTRQRSREAASRLRGRVQSPVADVAALIPGIRRLAQFQATGDGPVPVPPSGPLNLIPEAEKAHFAQVIGSLLRHPQIALLLGLRVDLVMPGFTGRRLIRLARPDGTPLDSGSPGVQSMPQPWSAVFADPANGRFVMATEDDPRAEVVNGMLDVRPVAGDTARYVVSDIDPAGIGQQLDVLASGLLSGPPRGPLALPARRTAGITLAQVDRHTKRFKHLLERNGRFEGTLPDEVEGAPVLYADDVTTGYRIDVSMQRGVFRSLMRRIVNYQIGAGPSKSDVTAADEGLIDSIVLTQQADSKNQPHVFVGEEIFGWTGWGFGGAFPGAVVGAEDADAAEVAIVEPAPLPGYPLHIKTRVEPATLTPLRFGKGYQFRARAVDLAGNTVEAAHADPEFLTPESVYRRYESVHPPVIVPRKRFAEGESLTHLVVTSDALQGPLSTTERHLAAPKTSYQLAELHGAFDPAFGPGVSQAVRDQMFQLATREEGSFLDPVVPGPGGPVPAAGIAVIGGENPTTLPLPRGEGLAAGEYIIHDTDRPLLPYLPDVGSAGPALTGLPGTTDPVTAVWAPGRPWPEAPPARLVVRPGASSGTQMRLENGQQVITVDLAPAARITARLSSAIPEAVLSAMDAPPAGSADRRRAALGQLPLLSPRQEITMVHAVKKPLTVPTMSGLAVTSGQAMGASSVFSKATVAADALSTGKIALEATWTEIVDRGYGPVSIDDRRVAVAAADFQREDTAKVLEGTYDFGDARHRAVTYRAVSGTRFREYFGPGDEREFLREGVGQVRHVPSRIRPRTPRVDSIVALSASTRQVVMEGNVKVFKGEHLPKGVRVYLKRPWHSSGEGELLGVLAARDADAATAIVANPAWQDKTSLLGADLYESWLMGGYELGMTQFLGRSLTAVDTVIPGINGGVDKFGIAGYAVSYDPEREQWFADVLLPQAVIDSSNMFLRLSLVAYQEHAQAVSGSGNAIDIRSSGLVVTDPVQLTSDRGVTARITGSGMPVQITVTNAANTNGKLRARWQVRQFEPTVWPNPAEDLCVDSALAAVIERAATSNSITFTIKPQSGLTAAQLDTLAKGRIVVEEVRTGWSLVPATGPEQERVLFTEVIELQDIL
jgi:hypothetical protein